MSHKEKNSEAAEAPEFEGGKEEPKWNSLELTKILLTASIPILIWWFGHQFSKKETEEAETRSKKEAVVKKRAELWDKIAIPLNQIYCYFLCVGDWKRLHATNVVALKREVDRTVYAYRPFFSESFHATYRDFMDSCFETYRGFGSEPGLRTRPERPLDLGTDTNYFTFEEDRGLVHSNYFQLLAFMSEELDMPQIKLPEVPKSESAPVVSNYVAATLNAGEPHLTGLKILFLTADDDKDDDTGLEVGIEDTTGDVYARGESSRVHFNDQSQHTVKLSVLRPILLNALGSFRLHIHISPRGHDTWRFRYTLSAEKSNGGSYVYSTQAMRPITLDQDHRDEVQLLPSGD